jgi:hypothetical protein
LIRGLIVAAIALSIAAIVSAYPRHARETGAVCAACHTNPAGGPELTAAGTAFKADPKKKPAAPAPTSGYIGTNKCRTCHLPQFTAWQKTGHAHAMETLISAPDSTVVKMAAKLKLQVKGKAADSDGCVGCHVVGHKLPGGYPATDSVKTAQVMNVGCEACHGPGAKHLTAALADKKKTINTQPTAKMCMQCHTPVMSPKFNFEEYRKTGVHPIPAKTEG